MGTARPFIFNPATKRFNQMSEVVTSTITIQGHEVEVSQPYVAGHVITEAEAKALNQTRSENIRNNTATKLKKMAKDAECEVDELSDDAVAEWLEQVAEYDSNYVFTLASVGGGRASALDPVTKEARRLARAAITAQLKESGVKVGDVDKEALDALVAETAEDDAFVSQAKANVENRKSVGADALSRLIKG